MNSNSQDRARMGRSQKNSIAIFGYKQWVLSIDMKTKIVQHVEREWMREWESARVWECESVRVRECESERVTFEPRHENKSCSACHKDQTWQPDNVTTWQPYNLTTWQPDNLTNWHFWAYTWKQKLFSMSQGSTLCIWHICHMTSWHDRLTNNHFWDYTWKQKLFSMSQGSSIYKLEEVCLYVCGLFWNFLIWQF